MSSFSDRREGPASNWLSYLVVCVWLSLLSTRSSQAYAAIVTTGANAAAIFSQLDANSDGFVSIEEVPPEKQGMLRRLLRTSDADSDKRLTVDEFVEALSHKRPEKPIEALRQNKVPGADALTVLLAHLDSNGDGRILRSEAPEGWTEAYELLAKHADQNKDGIISRFELGRDGPRLAKVSVHIVRRLKIDVEAEMRQMAPQAMDSMRRLPGGPVGEPSPKMVLDDSTTVAEMFEFIDANGDGIAERSEISENRREKFERLLQTADRDHDGSLNKTEFNTGMKRWARSKLAEQQNQRGRKQGKKPDRKPKANQILKRILRADQNGDGNINREEAAGQLKQNFGRIDANNDGLLDRAELKRLADRLEKRSTRDSN